MRKRRFVRPRKGMNNTRSTYPVSSRAFVKLKYTEIITPAASGVLATNTLYLGNGIYDPSVAIGGHQPLGRDQWFNFYDRCFVRASKITVKPVALTNQSLVVVLPQESNVGATSVDIAAEKPSARSKMVSVAGTSTGFMKHYATTFAMLGKTRRNAEDDDLTCTASADPTNLWYWNIVAQSPDLSTNSTVSYQVDITYYCTFFKRLRLAQS